MALRGDVSSYRRYSPICVLLSWSTGRRAGRVGENWLLPRGDGGRAQRLPDSARSAGTRATCFGCSLRAEEAGEARPNAERLGAHQEKDEREVTGARADDERVPDLVIAEDRGPRVRALAGEHHRSDRVEQPAGDQQPDLSSGERVEELRGRDGGEPAQHQVEGEADAVPAFEPEKGDEDADGGPAPRQDQERDPPRRPQRQQRDGRVR